MRGEWVANGLGGLDLSLVLVLATVRKFRINFVYVVLDDVVVVVVLRISDASASLPATEESLPSERDRLPWVPG